MGFMKNDRLLHQVMARTYFYLLMGGQIESVPGHPILNTDMNKPHKHAALIHAWADGAEIQRLCGDGWYDDSDTPEWYEDSEYRIKPRSVKNEGWVNIYRQPATELPAVLCCLHPTEKVAKQMASVEVIATVKVEWEEEVE